MSSKSQARSGKQTVGSKFQHTGVTRLASPPGPPPRGSKSAMGKTSSCPLPPGQAVDSVSISVHGQGPVQQESVPIERDGHEDVSLKMHHLLSLAVEGHCPSRMPMSQCHPSRSPVDGHHLASTLVMQCCLSALPVYGHQPVTLPVEASHSFGDDRQVSLVVL